MNVLVIAPHPDDESIGCGGTICRHAERGDRVAVTFLTSGEQGVQGLSEEKAWHVREREAEKAAGILGIASVSFLRRSDGHLGERIKEAAEALAPILAREKPKVIYLPHEHDWHPDHRAAMPIVRAALSVRKFSQPSLRSYEVLTPLTEYDHAEDISAVMQHKLKAARAHRSQIRQFRYDRAMRALSEYRGTITGAGRYAEVFQLADDSLRSVPRFRRADPLWWRVHGLMREINQLVPARSAFILVDDGFLQAGLLAPSRRCIPFLEKDGQEWGKPADDITAIQELTRLQRSGAAFMIFAWPALWWLDHYVGLRDYLHARFRCLMSNHSMIAFDLRKPKRIQGKEMS